MDQVDVFAPILTKGRTDDGILWVEGKITGPDLDGDLQRMDPVWLKTAVPEWARIGNVREAHDPRRPVGKAVEVWDTPDGSWYMRAKIVDKAAAEKVEHGVYTGFSIGVKGATIIKTQDAPMGLIGGTGRIVETSLADRPCLPSSVLTIAKADAAGVLQPLDSPKPVDVPKAEQIAGAVEILTGRYVSKAMEGSEQPDIAGARAAIAAIVPLIQHEIDGLTSGEQSEQWDVQNLLTALGALTSFLASEVAESQEDKMDAATKAEIAELVKAEVADALKANSETLVADLTKALTPEPVEGVLVQGESLFKSEDFTTAVTDAVAAAIKPVTDALANVTQKVDSIPVGGGPAITRTETTQQQTASPEKQRWLDYAATPGLSPDLRDAALSKAESL